MKKPTLEDAFDDARAQCLECDGARKLVSSHCTGKLPDGKTCRWFKYRKYRLERCEQLTIFPFDEFKKHCEYYLANNYHDMLRTVWWSDVRLLLSESIGIARIKQPQPRWWSAIAQDVFPRIGWRISGKTRTSPINKARENQYEKTR